MVQLSFVIKGSFAYKHNKEYTISKIVISAKRRDIFWETLSK